MVARYEKNEPKKVVVGSEEPVLTLSGTFADEAQARTEVAAALENITQRTIEGEVEIPGREIRAGGVIQLTGFGEDDGLYRIKMAFHRIDSSGYTTRVEFTK